MSVSTPSKREWIIKKIADKIPKTIKLFFLNSVFLKKLIKELFLYQ
jgi:hypothetical protein